MCHDGTASKTNNTHITWPETCNHQGWNWMTKSNQIIRSQMNLIYIQLSKEGIESKRYSFFHRKCQVLKVFMLCVMWHVICHKQRKVEVGLGKDYQVLHTISRYVFQFSSFPFNDISTVNSKQQHTCKITKSYWFNDWLNRNNVVFNTSLCLRHL